MAEDKLTPAQEYIHIVRRTLDHLADAGFTIIDNKRKRSEELLSVVSPIEVVLQRERGMKLGIHISQLPFKDNDRFYSKSLGLEWENSKIFTGKKEKIELENVKMYQHKTEVKFYDWKESRWLVYHVYKDRPVKDKLCPNPLAYKPGMIFEFCATSRNFYPKE